MFYNGETIPSDKTISSTLLELVQDDVDDQVFIELGITEIPTATKSLRAAKKCAKDMWERYLDEMPMEYSSTKRDRARRAKLRKQIQGPSFGVI